MKIVSKLLCSITLLVLLKVTLSVFASGMATSPIVYGEQMQASIAYDGTLSPTFDYDDARALQTKRRIKPEEGVVSRVAARSHEYRLRVGSFRGCS